MSAKDSRSPATTSLAYDEMLPSWSKTQTVLNGTRAMREAGRTYLPQHDKESDQAYTERLSCATLLNLTALTLNSWVGRPFSKPIHWENLPPQIEELLWDVDQAGTDVMVFCRDWFYDGLAKALSHVYIDFPTRDDGVQRTLADDSGLRPYWLHLQPEQVFFVDTQVESGREVLREVRWFESEVERDGYAEVVIPQIRRVYKEGGVVAVEVYRLVKKKWELYRPASVISLTEIPLVTFYSHRTGLLTGKSPIEDLVDLNIAHWQSNSDQRSILTVARFPILAGSGITDDDHQLVIGPNRWLSCKDPQGKFYYVEHTGAAIGAGRADLSALEEAMAQYGGDFLRKRPQITATQRVLDNAEVTSPLQDATIRFSYALKRVLDLTANWLNMEDGGVPTLSTDFEPEDISEAELTALRESRKMRDISRTAYLTELQRRRLLDEEFDIEADAVLLEQEATDLFADTAPLMDEDEE